MTKEERAIRDADFAARLKPRTLWPSTEEGTAKRVETVKGPRYTHHQLPAKGSGTRKLTEAEDNARGRAIRRRQNKRLRSSGIPHAKR